MLGEETLSPATIARMSANDNLDKKLGMWVTSGQWHALNVLADSLKRPVASIIRDAIMEHCMKKPVFAQAYLEYLASISNKQDTKEDTRHAK